jgi:hypothetical protein
MLGGFDGALTPTTANQATEVEQHWRNGFIEKRADSEDQAV